MKIQFKKGHLFPLKIAIKIHYVFTLKIHIKNRCPFFNRYIQCKYLPATAVIDTMLLFDISNVGYGKEKLWTAQNLPGLPGLGIRESGDVWKGPISHSTSAREKGPM